MFIGAHVSIAGSFSSSLDRIHALGGTCLMTFASSPRSLQTKQFPPAEIKLYQTKKSQWGIGPHFFHGVYLINLATDKPSYLQASLTSLQFYQHFAGIIGGAGTIFHLGSHQGRGFASVFDQITSSIEQILTATPAGVNLYLENAAGHSGVIGDDLVQLSRILDKLGHPPNLQICLDTQHAFATGIPLPQLLDQFDSHIGLTHLGVIHLNDSQVEFATHRDRHANWGEGHIPIADLTAFLTDPRLATVPLILETPGQNRSGPRKQDIDLIKSLVVE